MIRFAATLLLSLLMYTLSAVAETSTESAEVGGTHEGDAPVTSFVKRVSVFSGLRTAELYRGEAKQLIVNRLEQVEVPCVQRPDWVRSRITVGDRTEEKVERQGSHRTYWRYLVPVGAVLAAGTGTYLLYSVRSR